MLSVTIMKNSGVFMDGRTSPGQFLAYLMAEQDISVELFCRLAGLDNAAVWSLLSDQLPVTQEVADRLGKVFHSPGFWLIRQAMWELKQPAADDLRD
ncbi:MAG: XRE family transcriptional regulator [Pantoea sp.]|jgi:antitoxin HigA-1|uniref:helix-turn-helix transcriptional regulator n=1 Tax=unclassified Pantoea TaxID=2630326 RepID=UPI0001B3FDD1|nr:XRE family transcriptional regulator [Pantoea sp. At-9b]ADU72219.1 putative plasmid maintenance system antidote protein, XRE family [Pantoea sp. At-9b]